MLTFLITPVVITLGNIFDLQESLRESKFYLLVVLAAAIAFDISKKQRLSVADPKLIVAAIMVQVVYCYNMTLLRYGSAYSTFNSGSLFQLLSTGVAPLLIVGFLAQRRPDFKDLHLPWIATGGLIVLIINLPLAYTSLGALSTESAYNNVATSYSSTKDYRVSLPGFPGVIAGGVFGAAISMACLAYAVRQPNLVGRIVACAGVALGIMCVFLTETRSAGLTMLPVALLLGTRSLERICRKPGLCASVAIGLPLLITTVYPRCVDVVGSSIASAAEGLLGRGSADSVIMLNGRVSLWEDFTAQAPGLWNAIVGHGPLGEFSSGVGEEAALRAGLLFRDPAVIHSHNIFLNTFYSNGIFGVALFGTFAWLLARRCFSNVLSVEGPAANANAAFVITLCSTGMIESLFSQNYRYFTPLCVLLACEVAGKRKESPRQVRTIKNLDANSGTSSSPRECRMPMRTP